MRSIWEFCFGLKLYARVWRFFLEAYLGYDWMFDLVNERTSPVLSGQPPMVSIPSPRVGGIEPWTSKMFWTRGVWMKNQYLISNLDESLVNLPVVMTPSFEFLDPEAIWVTAAASAAGAGESHALSSLMVHPNTPQGTLSTWNVDTKVHLMVLQKTVVCGAQIVSEGEEDFIACASASCEIFSHRGRKPGYYVDLPLSDVEVFVI